MPPFILVFAHDLPDYGNKLLPPFGVPEGDIKKRGNRTFEIYKLTIDSIPFFFGVWTYVQKSDTLQIDKEDFFIRL